MLTTVPLALSETRRLLPASPPADLTNRATSLFTALVSSSSMARPPRRLSYQLPSNTSVCMAAWLL